MKLAKLRVVLATVLTVGLGSSALVAATALPAAAATPVFSADQTFASNDTGTAASLNTTVNPGGVTTTFTFCYSTTTFTPSGSTCAGTSVTPGTSSSNSSSAISISASVTGLTAGKLYYFAASATQSGTTTWSPVVTFMGTAGGDFSCTPTLYEANGDYLYAFSPTSDSFTKIDSTSEGVDLNGIGYDDQNNYIYGWTGSNLYEIDAAGTATEVTSTAYAHVSSTGGDFLPNTSIMLTEAANGDFYIDDVTSPTEASASLTEVGGDVDFGGYDIGLQIVGSDYVGYGMKGTTLYQMSIPVADIPLNSSTWSATYSGIVTVVDVTGITATADQPGTSDTFGSSYQDADGDVFFFDNTTSAMYEIPAATVAKAFPSVGTAGVSVEMTELAKTSTALSGTTDGASCVDAGNAFAPLVTTNAATSVTGTGADLSGTVDSNGSAVTATSFIYSTSSTTTNGKLSGTTVTSTPTPALSSSTTQDYTLAGSLSGLTPGTTYYYQAVGTNGVGTNYGNVESFTTSAATYTVTFSSNYPYPSGGSGTMSTESFTEGVAQDLTANAFSDTGYTFTGWNTAANGSGTSYTNQESITVSASETLYAQWTANTDTVTFSSNYPYPSGGSGSMSTESFTSGTAQNLTANAFSDTGYTFTGWNTAANGSGTSYANSASITIYGSETLYAQWTANTDTVTFSSNYPYPSGGSGSMSTESFTSGTAQNLTANAFSDTGYTFTGWNTAANGSGTSYANSASITIYGSETLYAQWTANTDTVTFSSNYPYPSGGSGSMSTESFTSGTAKALTTNGYADTGYTFTGWNTAANGSGTSYANSASITIYGSETLYAQWTANTDTVTFSSNYPYPSGGSGSMSTESFTSGTAQNLTANAFSDTGYTFTGWNTAANGSGTSYANSASITIYGSETLYAQWTANTDTVTFSSNYPYPSGGSGSMSTESFTSGTAKALTTNGYADTGYTFTGWNTAANGSGTSYANSASITIYGSETLYAQWTANTDTVSFNANDPYPSGGSGSMSTESFTSGTAKALTTNGYADTGYTFTGWNTAANGSGTSYANSASITIYGSETLYAQWTANTDTVTFSSNYPYPSGGSGSMSTESFTSGTAQNLTANAFSDTGYTFTGWNTAADGSGTAYSDGATITVYGDVTLYAQWTANTDTVSFNANDPYPGGAGGSTPSEEISSGTPTALTTNGYTDTGYTFTGWNTAADGSGTAYSDGATITVYGDVTLYAQWTANTDTVSFNANDPYPGGAGGSTPSEEISSGTPTALTTNGYTDTGYTFTGWNTAADGSGTAYSDGATITVYGDVTLYAQWTANTDTVSFNANDPYPGGAGGSTPSEEISSGTPTALTTNGYTDTGYTFTGWNTAADGSGTAYSDGATITVYGDVTLYAQWTANTDTVSFNANDPYPGGAGGSTPSEEISSGTPTALTTNGYTDTGYTFTGWNTAADGSGTAYSDGATITVYGDVTLYAQWTANTDTVSFNANDPYPGGAGGSTPSEEISSGTPTALTTNGYTDTGYTFTGWNTAADGSGTAYSDGATITVYGDVTLYAQWTANTDTVSFNANDPYPGGAGGSTPSEEISSGTPTALTTNGYTDTGYTFTGWNTAADGSGTAYSDGATITVYGDVTLYAQWTANTDTVSFNANDPYPGGAGGSTPSEEISSGTPTALTTNGYTDTGYTFTGWNTAADGSGTAYSDGATITVYGDVTLYAQWTINSYNIIYNANGGSGGTTKSELFDSNALSQAPTVTYAGHTFLGWSTNPDATTADVTDTVTANQTLYAVWKVDLTVNQSGSGTVTVSGVGTVVGTSTTPESPGSTVTIVAKPTSSTEVVVWTGACSGHQSDTCTVTMTQAQTVHVAFAPKVPDFFFATNKWNITLTKGQAATIVKDLKAINADGIRTIYLTGYADVRSTSKHNKFLSIERATSVRKYLTAVLADLHIKGFKFIVRAAGQTKQFGNNLGANRRVTVGYFN